MYNYCKEIVINLLENGLLNLAVKSWLDCYKIVVSLW